jgi:hypothetical protein
VNVFSAVIVATSSACNVLETPTMMLRKISLGLLSILGCLSLAPRAGADAVFAESAMGDFSNLGTSPTDLGMLGAGHDQITGTTGQSQGTIDRDYVTFTVPTGFVWSGTTVLPGTQSGGQLSFLGLQAGSQVTVSPNASDATGLLGWTHYNPSDIGTDILPRMGTNDDGATGFTPPLAAGSYSLWVQDFNPGTFSYGFDLQISPAPEAAPSLFAGFAMLAALGFLTIRSSSRRTMTR